MISVEMAVSETDGSTGRDSRMLDDVSSSDFKAPLPIITSQGSSAPESSDQQKAVAPSESSGDADIASTRQVESSFHPPALKYDEPSWTATSTGDYFLEVVKNGTVVNNISLKDKSFFVVGRLPNQCDVCVEHPSCSRFHAVFQFGKNPENNLLLQVCFRTPYTLTVVEISRMTTYFIVGWVFSLRSQQYTWNNSEQSQNYS